MECCPDCHARFPARRALAQNQFARLFIAAPALVVDFRVRCPACAHVCKAKQLRFFGFASERTLVIAQATFFSLALLVAIGAVLMH